MQLPTPRQVAAGNEIAGHLITASIWKQLGGLGGAKEPPPSRFDPIIKLFIADEIDSVTAMWMAMQQEGSSVEAT